MQPPSLKGLTYMWGKVIGGAIGLVKGGLWGAVFGIFLGHLVDRFIQGLRQQGQVRVLFFRTLFGALGHLNKADGRVTEVEIATAENLMHRLELNAEERQAAIRAFNEGKQLTYPLEAHLKEFWRHTFVRQDLRLMFLEILIEGAAADGKITQAEESVLFRVCRALQIPMQVLTATLYAARAARGEGPYRARPGQPPPGGLERAFSTLGLDQGATDAEVKKAYRKLVRQYHPDRLVSQGLPEEMMEKAKVRVREINTAYDAIKQARGIK